MKRNNFYLSLLGDFYQTVGVNALLSTIDSVHSDFLFRKYDSIIHRYLQSDKLGYCISKTCFIDMSSYIHGKGFKILDISKNEVENILSISSSRDFSFFDVTFSDGYYKIPKEIQDQAINSGFNFFLIYSIVKDDTKKNNTASSNLFNIPTTEETQKDAVDLIAFSIANGFISRKKLGEFVSILLGSPFVATKKEVILDISSSEIKTDKNIYYTLNESGEIPFSVGDALSIGTPFYNLCSFSTDTIHSSQLLELEKKINKNPSNVEFLKTLYKNMLKTTAIVELDNSVFNGASKETLNILSILNEYVISQNIVFATRPIKKDTDIATKEDWFTISSKNRSFSIKEESILKASLKRSIDVEAKEKALLKIANGDEIEVFEQSKYDDIKMTKSTLINLVEKDNIIETDGSDISTDELWLEKAKLQEVSIYSLKDKKVMVTKFFDSISFQDNNEITEYIFENAIKTNIENIHKKTSKLIRKSIIESSETPVIAQSIALIANSFWSKSYYSETVEKQNVTLSENSASLYVSTSDFNANDSFVGKIKTHDSIIGGSKGDGSGVYAVVEYVDAETMLEKPIIHRVSDIKVEDYAYIKTDNQIDF